MSEATSALCPASPPPALQSVPALVESLIRRRKMAAGDAVLGMVRSILSAALDPGVPLEDPGQLIEALRTGKRVADRLTKGATLHYDSRGGPRFILCDDSGRELATATSPGEISLILDAVGGRSVRKRAIVVKAGPIAARAAKVRYRGESMTALVNRALEREVASREAQIAEELHDLDEGIARDGLAIMAGGVQ